MKRLSDLQPLLQITPPPLIDSQESGSFVLGVVGDHNTYEQGQSYHTAQENIRVNIDRMYLENSFMRLITYVKF